MRLLPATFYVNDLICLARSGLALVPGVRAFPVTSNDAPAVFLLLMLAVFAGVADSVVNLILHDFAQSWRVAFLCCRSGPLWPSARRRGGPGRNHDRRLAELRGISAAHGKDRARDGP
ncbi:hypothetical protein [Falsigemmobacter faecalis]|uniref:Uncharacterized protein n=1 Tax=Falsigemmobacter faecalis TaxID=2488730 RepID=A0A3P3D363_9RHOB|nr:hypothetical protein [Falsigemmobacter faecalis]RRH68863.1 hypothetical protein EG244_19165 [Falsigemmobacter faecalis]